LKVEKINSNKASIIVTLDELSKRKITLKDIKDGAENVQDFFFEILEDTDIIGDFSGESSQLFIEVATAAKDIFIITITKVDCIPDTAKFKSFATPDKISYRVSSNVYSFSSISNLYNFCKKAIDENLYVGINSLYELNNKYFLLFSETTIKKSDFVKTFSIISEYSDKYFSKQTTTFLEYAKLIIPRLAIQTLQKI